MRGVGLADTGISGIIPAFGNRGLQPLQEHSEGSRVHPWWEALDGAAGKVARLSRRCASAELEDKLPVRQLVTLLRVLDHIGQSWPAFRGRRTALIGFGALWACLTVSRASYRPDG